MSVSSSETPKITPLGNFANVRDKPGRIKGTVLRELLNGEVADVSKLYQDIDDEHHSSGRLFTWYGLSDGGYIREDVVQRLGNWNMLDPVEADTSSSKDLYPNPVEYTSLGEYTGSEHGNHWGWNAVAPMGAPISAGPNGGTIVLSEACEKCGSEGKSSRPLTLDVVGRDPGWNYGYGHCIIIRYDHDKLPNSTQQYLENEGWGGYHAFVMYAHLRERFKNSGEETESSEEIGLLGNSGNSSGPHLHVEVRYSQNMNADGVSFAEWFNQLSKPTDPKHLFSLSD